MLYYDAWIFRYEQSKVMAFLKICMHWKYANITEWKKNMHGPDCSGPGANEARVSAECVCVRVQQYRKTEQKWGRLGFDPTTSCIGEKSADQLA